FALGTALPLGAVLALRTAPLPLRAVLAFGAAPLPFRAAFALGAAPLPLGAVLALGAALAGGPARRLPGLWPVPLPGRLFLGLLFGRPCLGRPGRLPQSGRQLPQPGLHPPAHGVRREVAAGVGFTHWDAREQLHQLVAVIDRVDVELARGHRFHHVFPKVEEDDVAAGDDDALPAREPLGPAHANGALNLWVEAAHGLHLDELDDGPGDGQILADGQPAQGRQERRQLRARRAVAVHLAVALLKDDPGRQGQGHGAGKAVGEVAAEDEHALGVDAAAQARLPLDVDDALAP